MSLPETSGHELQDLIGNGSVGAVYRALGSGGKPCAVKVFGAMSINRKGLGITLRQLQAMPPHRGVLPVLGFDMDRSPYHMMMPLVGVITQDAQGRKVWQSTSLESLCGRLSPDDAWNYIYELADSMAWLHKHQIAHGNLKCSNVLLTDDPEGATRITDMGQGFVGGVHHLELRDHFMYLCPDQAEFPDSFFQGAGMSWDVYSFGVIAWRLLNGHFPRAEEAWLNECSLRQAAATQGKAYNINGGVIIQAVRAQPQIKWPTPAPTPWEERRRHIIERALDFDSNTRWKDVREIAREFEILEADFTLEESRAQTVAEREKQKGRIRRLHALWLGLAVALGLALFYGVTTQIRLLAANRTIASNLEDRRKEISLRDTRIATLENELAQTKDWKAVSDANLLNAQSLVDQLVTQLVQLPTDNNLQVAFSKQQLADISAYLQKTLPGLEAVPDMAQERARAYGNLGMIYLRQRNTAEAVKYLDKARIELHALVTREPNNPRINLFQQWLGRFSLLLAKMRAARGDGDSALGLFKEATENLDPGLQNNPHDRNARYEAAQAWFEYGARCRMEGLLDESEKAFTRVTAALDEAAVGGQLLTEERFLLARGDLERGLALRDAGKAKDAADALLAGVDNMAVLVQSSAPQNKDQALILAEAYTDLADLIARNYSAKEASEAHVEAIKVLLELIRLDPEWKEVKYLLARNYGQVAGLERDMGNQSEALRKKKDAIEAINEVVSDDPENRTYLYHQAKLRGELAELMAESGKAKEAIPVVQQAIDNLKNLLQQLPGNKQTAQRREWNIQLAIQHGIQGQVYESARQKDPARAAYSAAEKQWQLLAEQNKENETVKNGLQWVKNKLQKLK